jgi:rRNA maturation endonuclease Nob1
MRDVDHDSDVESVYECFGCGTVVTAEANPGRCEHCGSDMRNRLMPIE